MKITLAIDSHFLATSDQSGRKLQFALRNSRFDRLQLTARSSDGDEVYNQEKFHEHCKIANDNGVELVWSIAAYENSSNIDNKICVQEAGNRHSETILTRICPSNEQYRMRLEEIVSALHNRQTVYRSNTIHLSYFRYENIGQCVCDGCLVKFAEYCGKERRNFTTLKSLLASDVLMDWVDWKQNVLSDVLRGFSCIKENKKISIELDFDHTKRYLAGPQIEEGLYLPKLLKSLNELYLHIEPCEPSAFFAKNQHPNARHIQRIAYNNHLRYITSLCSANGVECHFFFWFLRTEQQIKDNLSEYLKLAQKSGANGVILYTDHPELVARELDAIMP